MSTNATTITTSVSPMPLTTLSSATPEGNNTREYAALVDVYYAGGQKTIGTNVPAPVSSALISALSVGNRADAWSEALSGTSAACASDRGCCPQDIPDERCGTVARRRGRRVATSIKISEGPGTIWPSTPDPRPLRLLVGEPFSRAFMPARRGAVQRPVGGRVGGAGSGSGVRLPTVRSADLCVPPM